MNVLRLLIYGNVLVSLAVGFLTFGVSSYYHYSNAFYYALCATLSTLFIYNLQRLLRFSDVIKESSPRHIWLSKHKWLLIILSAIGGGGAITTYFFIGFERDFQIVILLTLIGFLYAHSGFTKIALRDLPFIKIYLIAFVWTSVSVTWPALRENDLNSHTLIIAVSVFFYVLAATIPFDIRDLIYDDQKKRTIPQQLGSSGSKVVSALLLIASASLLAFLNPEALYSPLFYIAFLGMLILVLGSHKERSEMYFSGLIDGWIIFFGLLFGAISF